MFKPMGKKIITILHSKNCFSNIEFVKEQQGCNQ